MFICVTEELGSIRLLKRTIKELDIFETFKGAITSLKVPFTYVFIITDGALNRKGTKSGFEGKFHESFPGKEVVFLYCVIHQEVLCKSALEMENVFGVIKLVNNIRSQTLNNRQFYEFLESLESNILIYFTTLKSGD